MYLDTDVLLALLKDDDWLQTDVESATFDNPKTSTVTAIEIQLVQIDSWARSNVATVYTEIEELNIDVIPLTGEAFQAGATLLEKYPTLNIFDSIHVGHARVLEEPLISTDTLYPKIEEITNIDPRDL